MIEKVSCPLFKKCGGCQLLNVTYQKTLQEKLAYVNKCLKEQKINFQIDKIIGSEKNVQYRNKMIIGFKKVNGKVISGFYEENSHQIIDLDDCLMNSPLQNQVARGLKEIIISMRLQPYDEDKKQVSFAMQSSKKQLLPMNYWWLLLLQPITLWQEVNL